MNLEKNYELMDVVRDDGIRTMKARETATGQALEVHLFVSAEDRALFERLQALPLSARRVLLEFGSELKIPYIVTDPVAGDTNARAWFTTLLKPMGEARPEPKQEAKPQPIKSSVWKTGTPLPDPLFPPDEKTSEGPGEFTRMFQTPPTAAARETPVPEGEFTRMFRAPVEPKSPDATPSVGVKSEAGEFTRMFQLPVEMAKKEEPDSVTKTMRIAPAAPDEEATRLFQIPVVKEPESAPVLQTPQAAPEKEPGEFTRLFQSMQPEPGAPGEAAKDKGPGEFTRMFQSPMSPGLQKAGERADVSAGGTPVPPPPQKSGGEFTQLFGTASSGPGVKPVGPLGSGFGQSATGAFAVPKELPKQHSVPQGPGQFTQMMSAGAVPTLGQQQSEQAAPVKAAGSNVALIVILGALALFAVLIVMFFAMRH